MVHSLEEVVGRLQVNQEGGEAAVAVDHYLGAVEEVVVAVVLLCCPAEGEEVVVLGDPGGEVGEGVGEEVAAEVPQPSDSAQWRPG